MRNRLGTHRSSRSLRDRQQLIRVAPRPLTGRPRAAIVLRCWLPRIAYRFISRSRKRGTPADYRGSVLMATKHIAGGVSGSQMAAASSCCAVLWLGVLRRINRTSSRRPADDVSRNGSWRTPPFTPTLILENTVVPGTTIPELRSATAITVGWFILHGQYRLQTGDVSPIPKL